MAMYQDAQGNWKSGEGDGKQYNYTNTAGQYVDNSGNNGPVYTPVSGNSGGSSTFNPTFSNGGWARGSSGGSSAPTYTVSNNSTTPTYSPSSQGAAYTPNVGIPAAAKPPTNGYQIGNGLMQGGYMPSGESVQQAPQTAVSSSTMNPATGQAYQQPGQFISPSYTPPMPTNAPVAIPPMDAAAIQKYAADQVAAKLAAATNSANQARTSAQGDAAQSTTLLDNQLAQAIARLQASAQQAQSGVQTGYDRANALTKDNRTLSDASFQRNTNPFSGGTDYKSAMIGREREISDRQAQEDLSSRLGSINQDAMNQQGAVEQDIGASKSGIQQGLTNLQNKITTDLQNLETSTGAEKERLIREITASEREYALMLRGEDRQDVMTNATLAQNQFNRDLETFKTNYTVGQDAKDFDYKVGRDVKTDFNYEEEKKYNQGQDKISNDRNAANDALVQRNQHLSEADGLSKKYGVEVQPKDDYQLMLDQVAGLPTVAQQTAEQQRITNQKTEAWKIVEFLGTVPEAYAELLGVPAGTQTQKAKEFAADQAYQQGQLAISRQNAGTSASSAASSASNAAARLELDRAKAEYDRDPNNPDNVLKLANAKKAAEGPDAKPYNYKADPDFMSDSAGMMANPLAAAKALKANASAYIQKYGMDGYNYMLGLVQK